VAGIIFGFGEHEAACTTPVSVNGVIRHQTPWNHLDAGIAFGYDLPILVLAKNETNRGIFDDRIAERVIHRLGPDRIWETTPTDALKGWLSLVHEHSPVEPESTAPPSEPTGV